MSTTAPRRKVWFTTIVIVGALALPSACADQRESSLTAPPLAARRTVTPTIVVQSTNDAGPGSLRQAILDAHDGDVIGFADAIAGQTILLTSLTLVVDGKAVEIDGPSSSGIVLDGSGLASSRVLYVATTAAVTISNLTITNGTSGGVENAGVLTVRNSTIANNQVVPSLGPGGGILSVGPQLTITNSTIYGNQAHGDGGGVAVHAGAATIVSTTILHNTAHDVFSSSALGGGIEVNGSAAVTLRNTIVAQNAADFANNCGGVPSLSGLNLSDDTSCGAAGANLMVAPDPMLGTLASNGGPTQTLLPAAGSPAIDAVPSGQCTVDVDQRYVARPQGSLCDIGSVEAEQSGGNSGTLTLASSGIVSPTTGAATVTGTLSCASATSVNLSVTLSQLQKTKKVPTTISGTNSISFNCNGTTPWSIAIPPSGGVFINGTASASAQTDHPAASATGGVKLFWGKK